MGSTGWACVRSSMPSSAESRSTVTASKSCSVCLQREGVPEMGWNPLARVFCRIVQTRRHEIALGGSAAAVARALWGFGRGVRAENTHRYRPPSNISAYVFCHHENNGNLHQALHSRKPDVDSVDADN